MLITRAKFSHFCSATFRALCVAGCAPKGSLSLGWPSRAAPWLLQGSLLTQHHQPAAPHTPAWALLLGHLDLYALGVSSARPAEFIPSSHRLVRQSQTLSLDHQTAQGCIAACNVLNEHSSLLLNQSSGKTAREKSKKADSTEEGAQHLHRLVFPPSHSEGFGFLSNCQQRNKPINRQPQTKGTRGGGGDGLTS